jgi:hypothetical protein
MYPMPPVTSFTNKKLCSYVESLPFTTVNSGYTLDHANKVRGSCQPFRRVPASGENAWVSRGKHFATKSKAKYKFPAISQVTATANRFQALERHIVNPSSNVIPTLRKQPGDYSSSNPSRIVTPTLRKQPGDYSSSSLKFLLWNAQSIRQKTQLTRDFMSEHDVDVSLIVETWLTANDLVEICDLEQNEYFFLNTPRENRIGGGIGVLAKKGLKVEKVKTPKTITFENMEILITSGGKQTTVITIYRAESSARRKYSMDEFYTEFSKFLSSYQCCNHELIITGDFNFHMNKPNDPRAKRFSELLEMFDLTQHVTGPTHKSGNTLDLIITRKKSLFTGYFTSDLNSDHNCILFDVKMGRGTDKSKIVRFRKTKNIDLENFKCDLRNRLKVPSLSADSKHYLNQLVSIYLSSREVLDKHAPEVERMVCIRKPNPWTNADIKNLKIEKRKAEKKWRKTRLTVHWEIFQEKRNALNKTLNDLRSKDLRTIMQKHKGNSKALFKSINSCLNRNQPPPLPDHSDAKSLADDFNTFFDDKISRLRSKFPQSSSQESHPHHLHQANRIQNITQTLSDFRRLSMVEVKKLVLSMPTKHCILDPMPTWLAKECLDEILPILTEIINVSLEIGEMPSDLKHAVIKPHLKKQGLELTMKNYRPVSNLTFLSKLIESAIISQFTEHLVSNKLADDKQSAYKKNHSTENPQ